MSQITIESEAEGSKFVVELGEVTSDTKGALQGWWDGGTGQTLGKEG
jgi:hypothetical protein